MEETDFWPALEYRVTREMEGSDLCAARGLWCDGFLPEAREATAEGALVRGRAWVGLDGDKQEPWPFLLWLPDRYRSTPPEDWSVLVPAEDATGWLAVDIDGARLEIDLRA